MRAALDTNMLAYAEGVNEASRTQTLTPESPAAFADQFARIETVEELVGTKRAEPVDEVDGGARVLDDAVRREKGHEFGMSAKFKQPEQLGMGEPASLILGKTECLEGSARHVAGLTEPGREVVGDRQGDVHEVAYGSGPMLARDPLVSVGRRAGRVYLGGHHDRKPVLGTPHPLMVGLLQ